MERSDEIFEQGQPILEKIHVALKTYKTEKMK
jgi:hypothetical protein